MAVDRQSRVSLVPFGILILIPLLGFGLVPPAIGSESAADARAETAQEEAPRPGATPAEKLRLLPGFRAERLYSVPRDTQGSWVSVTVDDKGRLIVCDQRGGLYRVTPPPFDAAEDATVVEKLEVDAGGAHGLLYAFDSLYVVQNERDPGLYRLRDTDGDDQFDEVQRLRSIDGRGEHGPHGVVLAPDGKSLYVVGGNHTELPKPEQSTVIRNWQEDLLLPRLWDANGHARGRLAPGGWVCRTDPDGRQWELVSIGYRNAYDLAFSPEGELFTYDSDMEWDIGLPWYRPTRVNHVTSGSDFGWRSGTGKWSADYIDSLPAVVDVGPGSPTGVVFGTGAKFPAKYQRALYICDWSYGKVYAAHLQPQGSSYVATLEPFVSASPLPATDLLVHPEDGALYFTVGGRGVQSGLYRVIYTGEDATSPDVAPLEEGMPERKIRRTLERMHNVDGDPQQVVDTAWPYLGHADRHIRYAARIAIEHQPVDVWERRALTETDPRRAVAALIALARNGRAALQVPILDALGRLTGDRLSEQEAMDRLRAVTLVFCRMGTPDTATREAVAERLAAYYPATSERLNRELSRLLVYLEADETASKTLELLRGAPTQEEQIHYALVLRDLRSGWTPELRYDYFSWFQRATRFAGGNSFSKFLTNIRNEAQSHLTAEQREAIQEFLTAPLQQEPNFVFEQREEVANWRIEDLLSDAQAKSSGHNFDRGRQMFAVAGCFNCHRVRGSGGSVGPDLTGVGGRFDVQYLLEATVEPNKVVSDQYQATVFVLNDGRQIIGRVVNLSGGKYLVMTDMTRPNDLTSIEAKSVEETHPSPVSMMPTGTLNTLRRDEVLDLLAYLRAGGDSEHALFRQP